MHQSLTLMYNQVIYPLAFMHQSLTLMYNQVIYPLAFMHQSLTLILLFYYNFEIIIFSDMEPIGTDDQVRNTLSGVEPIDMEHLLRTYVLPCGRDTVYGRK